MARIFSVTHDEYTPWMACSCSPQRAGLSYLQALPPHAREQAMWPGITCRKRSPTFVYFGVGRPEFLFLWRLAGFLSAQLTEATATITWREDEESVWAAEPRRPCCRTGSEDECRRPWKKELRKGRAEHRRGRSCMAGLPAGKSCGQGDGSASLLRGEVTLSRQQHSARSDSHSG